MYLARRMVRMASEDIGLAEPGALAVTLRRRKRLIFWERRKEIWRWRRPRCICRWRQNRMRCIRDMARCMEDVQKTEADPVPLHLRNAVTGLMKNVGYGKGYKYAHNFKEKVTDMQCLPDNLSGNTYYKPSDQGFEARVRTRMEEIRKLKVRGAGK